MIMRYTTMINKIPSGLIIKSIPLIGRISMRIFEEYYKNDKKVIIKIENEFELRHRTIGVK